MPRLRPLFTAATTLSLTLLLAATSLWIRSHFSIDRWVWGTPPHAYHVRSRVGWIDFEYANIPSGRAAYGTFHVPIDRRRMRDLLAAERPRAIDYHAEHLQLPPVGLRPAITADTHVLRVRYWLICLVTALAPSIRLLLWMHHRRHRQRTPATLCPTCGYDLRATPTRCPECGTIPSPQATLAHPSPSRGAAPE